VVLGWLREGSSTVVARRQWEDGRERWRCSAAGLAGEGLGVVVSRRRRVGAVQDAQLRRCGRSGVGSVKLPWIATTAAAAASSFSRSCSSASQLLLLLLLLPLFPG
jgi:hypothetical protein